MNVLLHTCCGVCASHCIKALKTAGHLPTLFFSNCNIAPKEEYLKRRDTAKKLAEIEHIPFIEDVYDHAAWRKKVQGLEECKEGGARCKECFNFSLQRAFNALNSTKCDAFTTSLTVSPYKKSSDLISIGKTIDKEKFLPFDFKKKNGYLESTKLAKEYGLYRQTYCGCEFSMRHPKPFKMILLGAGYRGRIYAEWALNHTEDIEIIAIAEPDNEIRKAVGKKLNLPETALFASFEEALENVADAELCVIALPDALHLTAAKLALERNLHLLLEKPIACSWTECLDLRRLVESTERLVIVGHILRYTAYNKEIKRCIDAGEIGEIVSIQHLEPVGYIKAAHSFCRGNWANAETSTPMIVQKCSHDFDQFTWWLNKNCQAVQSFGSLRHFRPEMKPANAAKFCKDCPADVERNCPYSAKKLYLERTDLLYTQPNFSKEQREKLVFASQYGRCVYACENNAVDHQIVNLLFEGGITISHVMEAYSYERNRITKIFGTRGELTGDSRTIMIKRFDTRKTTKWDVVFESGGIQKDSGYAIGNDGIMKEMIRQLRTGNPNKWFDIFCSSLESHKIAFAAEKSRLENGICIPLEP